MSFNFNSFGDLDLTKVDASSSGTLKPGRYLCKVTEAEFKKTAKALQVVVKLSDTASKDSIKDFINVRVFSSDEATGYGLQRLKKMLVAMGHPNPDKPGDIATLRGREIGVVVKEDTYEKDGEKRKGSKVNYYITPDEIKGTSSAASSSGSGFDNMPDDIPF